MAAAESRRERGTDGGRTNKPPVYISIYTCTSLPGAGTTAERQAGGGLVEGEFGDRSPVLNQTKTNYAVCVRVSGSVSTSRTCSHT